MVTLIRKAFETHMGINADRVIAIAGAMTNTIFKIEAAGSEYQFKIYASQNWPESGKLRFINSALEAHKIPHARLFVFERGGSFPNGFSISEFLPGETADKLRLDESALSHLFSRMGRYIFNVHKIKINGFGFIGSGSAGWDNFSEFVYDMLPETTSNLSSSGFLSTHETERIREHLSERLRKCNILPPVLCHGDLSLKNVLFCDDELTLLDWDDAHALCAVSDFARLAVWLKLSFGKERSVFYERAFLDGYGAQAEIELFNECKNELEFWHCLDFLNFYVGKPEYEKTKWIFRTLREACGL